MLDVILNTLVVMLTEDCEDIVNVLPFSIVVLMNNVSISSRSLIQVIFGAGRPSNVHVRERDCPLSAWASFGLETILGPSVTNQTSIL